MSERKRGWIMRDYREIRLQCGAGWKMEQMKDCKWFKINEKGTSCYCKSIVGDCHKRNDVGFFS
jgi:hypothetical protein